MDNFPGKNITAKIVALILASILWMYVMNEQNPPIEASFTVSLEQRNLDPNLVISNVPDSVRVRARGPRSIIAGISAKDIICYIDLNGLVEGKNSVKVNTAIPAALELLEANPDKILLRLDSLTSRELPVEIRLKGNTLVGMVVGKTSATPAQVVVAGPRNLVDSVQRVIAVVDLSGKTNDVIENVDLIALNRDGKDVEGVIIKPQTARISLDLNKEQNKVTVGIKTIIFGELPPGIVIRNITTKPEKVQLSGSPEELKKIDYVYTESIDINGITKDTSKDIKLQIKEGILSSNDKVTVQINVQKVTP